MPPLSTNHADVADVAVVADVVTMSPFVWRVEWQVIVVIIRLHLIV